MSVTVMIPSALGQYAGGNEARGYMVNISAVDHLRLPFGQAGELGKAKHIS